ncbi:MAG: sigma-70 family RNA polymerase sigma factor [Candidatus Omnitrophota bacterium]|jgi:RNA polymerase sigma-70 factor (ECF subfamily)
MDDLQFVQRCVKGDALAWDEFISRYSRLVYNYIHSMLGLHGIYRPAQDSVSDLFQEIFLSLIKDDFRKLRTFKAKNGCSLASWLRQVTINHTIDYLRKARVSVSLEEEDSRGTALKDNLADDAPTALDESIRQDKLAHLEDCISRLEADDRYFLELHLNRGFSLEELKDILKIGRGAVDMRKSRIIERLRDCFQKKGFVMPRRAEC